MDVIVRGKRLGGGFLEEGGREGGRKEGGREGVRKGGRKEGAKYMRESTQVHTIQ